MKLRVKIQELITQNRSFIKQNAFAYAVIIFNIGISLVAIKTNLAILKEDLYGVWIIAFGIANLIILLHFGYSSICIFRFNKYQEEKKLELFFSSNFYIILCQAALTLAVLFSIYYYAHLFIENLKFQSIFKQLLLFITPGITANTFSVYLESVLFFNFRLVLYKNFLDFMKLGIMQLSFIFGLYFWGNVLCLGLIYSLISIVVLGFSFYKFTRVERISISKEGFNPNYMKTNFSDAFSYWIISFSSIFLAQSDVFFISSLKKNLAMVTMYSQSFRLQDIALKFIKKIAESKSPKILQLVKENNHHAVYDIYKKLILINLGLSITAFIGITLTGKIVLEYWLNYQIIFDQQLISVLSLICISASLHWVLWSFCNMTNQHKKIRYFSILEVIVNFTLSYVLIQKIGLIGLGIASISSQLITISYSLYLFRKYGKSIQ